MRKKKILNRKQIDLLILGIGNILLSDEGIGVHAVKHLEKRTLPINVECLDGGTGGFQLLEIMEKSKKIIIIDATIDGNKPGTITKLKPRYSSDYPRTLTAHDIGLKDLIDIFYMKDKPPPEVTLFVVSIDSNQQIGLDLSENIKNVIPDLEKNILAEL